MNLMIFIEDEFTKHKERSLTTVDCSSKKLGKVRLNPEMMLSLLMENRFTYNTEHIIFRKNPCKVVKNTNEITHFPIS